MELSNFNDFALTLQDFKSTAAPISLNLGNTTKSQLAAAEVLMSEGADEEKFRAQRESLSTKKGREAYIEAQRANTQKDIGEYNNTIGGMLVDGTLDPTKAADIATELNQYLQENPVSTTLRIAEESLAAPSGNETDEEAGQRLSILDSLEEVNQQKRQMASLINGIRAERDPTFASTVGDFAEIIVPFAEWIYIDKIYQEVTGDEGVIKDENLLGNQKDALFDKIQGMPVEDRMAFAQKLVDYIDSNDQIILPDGNDLVLLDTLENALLSNDYGWFEKQFDNLTSILDVVGIGALARAPRAASRAAKGVDTIEGVDDAVDPVTAAVRGDDTPEVAQARKVDTQTTVNPAAPSQIVRDTNPEKARQMLEAADADTTGDVSTALYGTNRTDAMAKEILPEPEIVPGTITNKVRQKTPQFEEPEHIRRLASREGRSFLSELENSKLTKRIVEA